MLLLLFIPLTFALKLQNARDTGDTLFDKPVNSVELEKAGATYDEECGNRNNYRCWKKGGHSTGSKKKNAAVAVAAAAAPAAEAPAEVAAPAKTAPGIYNPATQEEGSAPLASNEHVEECARHITAPSCAFNYGGTPTPTCGWVSMFAGASEHEGTCMSAANAEAAKGNGPKYDPNAIGAFGVPDFNAPDYGGGGGYGSYQAPMDPTMHYGSMGGFGSGFDSYPGSYNSNDMSGAMAYMGGGGGPPAPMDYGMGGGGGGPPAPMDYGMGGGGGGPPAPMDYGMGGAFPPGGGGGAYPPPMDYGMGGAFPPGGGGGAPPPMDYGMQMGGAFPPGGGGGGAYPPPSYHNGAY